jgi:hypothetical protein
MWILTRDAIATKPKHDIHTEKLMFKWIPLRFHVVEKLPTGAKINSHYFTTNTLAPF